MKNFVIFCLLLLSACGYSFPGKSGALPGGVKTIHIPLFRNLTAEPLLENQLSSTVSEVFAQSGKISQIEKRDQAEAVLEGVISSYSNRALSYNKNDNISEYRSTMSLAVKLRQVSDERLLWQGDLRWDSDYFASDDKMRQEDLEQQAIDEITRRLAEELYFRLLDDF